jgi:hypothetical protein
MMQVINQLYKLNCFNCAVGKIIIKNFIAHNGMQLNDVFLPIRKTPSFSTNFTGQKNIV